MRARALLTTVAIGALAALALWRLTQVSPSAEPELVVYCATGVRPALEEITKEFEAQSGVRVTLQYGPSGSLEAQIRLSQRGDLFLPAAESPYLTKMLAGNLVSEVRPLAQQRLGVAFAPTEPAEIGSIDALLASGLAYGLCNEQAAAGLCTKQALEPLGLWQGVSAGCVATFPTVTELASAVRDSGRLRAAILWNATAAEFGLRWAEAPELASATETISVGLLRFSELPTEARRFIDFLADAEHGQRVLATRHFTPLAGANAAASGLHPPTASTTIKP